MKYCPNCGAQREEYGLYCLKCDYGFTDETLAQTSKSEQGQGYFSPPTRSPPSVYTPPTTQSTSYVESVRGQYRTIINDVKCLYFINGSLALVLAPIFSIIAGIFLEGFFIEEDNMLIILDGFLQLFCFTLFIFGIYSVAQLEPRTLNDQLKQVPVFLALFALLNYISAILINSLPPITATTSLNELQQIVSQGFLITMLQTGAAVLFVAGAFRFTKWFEHFVIILEMPHTAHTNRILWLALSQLLASGLTALSFLMLSNAIDTFSESLLNTTEIVLGLAAIFILATLVLQVAGGYKIYSKLNDVRKGKYDGTYQQYVMAKYQ